MSEWMRLSEIILEVEYCGEKEDVDRLDHQIATILEHAKTPTEMVCWLRASYVYSPSLPSYKSALRIVEEELNTQGMDGKKILRGLDKHPAWRKEIA